MTENALNFYMAPFLHAAHCKTRRHGDCLSPHSKVAFAFQGGMKSPPVFSTVDGSDELKITV